MKNKKFDLQDRLIDYSVKILELAEELPENPGSRHLRGQILRSGTSPALNYGEAQAAESKADFVHKFKVCLKELRETYINLQIIMRKGYLPADQLEFLIKESDELIAIFVSSLRTVSKKEG